MAFNENVRQFVTTDTNIADLWNGVNNKLLENTKYNKEQFDLYKSSNNTEVAAIKLKNTQQDAEINKRVLQTTYDSKIAELVDKNTMQDKIISKNDTDTKAKDLEQDNRLNKIEPELTNKINIQDKLDPIPERIKNGFYLQNKDVVRDGLVEKANIPPSTNKKITLPKSFCLSASLTTSHSGWIFVGINTPSNPNNWGIIVHTNNEVLVNVTSGTVIKLTGVILNPNRINTITLTQSKAGEITLVINEKSMFIVDDRLILQDFFDIRAIDKLNEIRYTLYNRPLTPQEIKYNFDSQGKNKVREIEKADGTAYAISALADDVFFDNGMNLERAMNQFVSWKTLTMGVDGTFPTTKVADWYSDRYSINGNTVKNILPTENVQTLQGDGQHYISNRIMISQAPQLKPSTQYTVVIDITENTLVADAIAVYGAPYAFTTSLTLPKGRVGIITALATTIANLSTSTDGVCIQTTILNTEIGYVKFRRCLIEGDYTGKVTKYIPFGLSSVGTTTSDGKTCLSYQCNGVTNCFELPHPLRKWDKVENGVDVIGTIEYTVNGTESFASDAQSYGEISSYAYITATVTSLKLNSEVICNRLEYSKFYAMQTKNGCIGTSSVIIFNIPNSLTGVVKEDIPSTMASKIRTYIKQEFDKGNPFIIQYQPPQPTSQEIKSTFQITPDTNGNADIRFTDAVMPNSAEIQVAQTADQISDRLTALENAMLLLKK